MQLWEDYGRNAAFESIWRHVCPLWWCCSSGFTLISTACHFHSSTSPLHFGAKLSLNWILRGRKNSGEGLPSTFLFLPLILLSSIPRVFDCNENCSIIQETGMHLIYLQYPGLARSVSLALPNPLRPATVAPWIWITQGRFGWESEAHSSTSDCILRFHQITG